MFNNLNVYVLFLFLFLINVFFFKNFQYYPDKTRISNYPDIISSQHYPNKNICNIVSECKKINRTTLKGAWKYLKSLAALPIHNAEVGRMKLLPSDLARKYKKLSWTGERKSERWGTGMFLLLFFFFLISLFLFYFLFFLLCPIFLVSIFIPHHVFFFLNGLFYTMPREAQTIC